MKVSPRIYLEDALEFLDNASTVEEVRVYLREVIENLPPGDNTLTMGDIMKAEEVLRAAGEDINNRTIGQLLGYSAPRVSQVRTKARMNG